ncbi:MAG: hypothetical protein COS25_01225 [Candidatus Nealsonbacteria bacterium CG02_land_8_20_14_3_00_37_10]|uniref:Uncharacterized protein n=1 Tax=Candidatus Nealsonbacteria bacterium CG02_land_8_20_14_3_00_37_10 TaxID=1974699 RepID=A0A2M7D9S4_9BACT|nr:MAG: hypothetical protein COS25_01225 [Candidatus Nealsonbacteria bacterium CG02_land_8_20_14_3_00_37_10]
MEELLPVYDYLYDEIGDDYNLRTSYPTNYPRNQFLESLNDQNRLQLLSNLEFTKVIGKKSDSASTVSGYNVIENDLDILWTHGYPLYFSIPLLRDKGMRRGYGDETVPLYSAEATEIPADETIYFESEHNALPTDAQSDILETLTSKKPASEVRRWRIPDILIILVHSPVDIQVVSPSGEKIGKNFENGKEINEIPDAFYSGFDTDTEFLTIPNPEDGDYKIIAQGTGEGGNYTIEAAKITENPADPDNAKESSVTIERETQTGEIQEAVVQVAGDQVIYNSDTAPPVISIFSPEEKDYTNDKILAIDYKAEDSGSGIANEAWRVEKDGENLNWQEKSVDLSLEHLGNYTLKVVATDYAGNSGMEEVIFQVTTSLDAIQNNINHYWDLKLIKKKIAKRYLIIKLKHIEKLFNLLEKIENSKLKPRPKQAAVNALKKIINVDIDRIIRQIKRKSPRWLDPKVANLLIESLREIKSLNN